MRAFIQLYRANVREWRRDSTALLWSMMFPVVIVLVVVVIFDLPLHARELPATLALVGLGAAVFIAFGYLLAAAKTDEAVQVLVGLPFLVFSMLSGVLVPYWRIPVSVRPVMDTIPLTYLADACAR